MALVSYLPIASLPSSRPWLRPPADGLSTSLTLTASAAEAFSGRALGWVGLRERRGEVLHMWEAA